MTALDGKLCVVTGATSGIGEAAATALAGLGAQLVLVCRNPQKGEATRAAIEAATGNENVSLAHADLASQRQIRELAERLLAEHPRIDVLLNNAGVTNLKYSETEDGIETVFAVNHLAPFLLTSLLQERLAASQARIVTVASDAYKFGGAIDLDDVGQKDSFRWMRVYGRSKLANILHTRALARRLDGSGATANAMHPGFVRTNLGADQGWIQGVVMSLAGPFARTPERGADTAVWLCHADEVSSVSGEYFMDRKRRRLVDPARDDAAGEALWTLSERMTGLA